MSTLTLAVADYFKQEPQQAAPELNHKVGPVGIPKLKKLQCHSQLLLSSPHGFLSTSAPPLHKASTIPKASSVVPVPHNNINMSYTCSSFSKLAPDLVSWPEKPKPRDDASYDPLSTPQVLISGSKAEKREPQATESPQEKPKQLPKEGPKESPKEDTQSPKEAAGSPAEKQRSASDTMPPLRKLKLSLKLPQLHKSNLTSQLSPKLVRFASRLENVKTFDGRDSPLAVSVQNTPMGSPSHFDFDVEDYFSNNSNFTDLALGSDDSDSDLDSFFSSVPQHSYRVSSTNFTPPQNIYDKISCPVYLQSVCIALDKKLMVLTVMCENLAFEKNLSVKITFNDWHSTVIYNNAQYVKSFSLLNFDQFKFNIPLTLLPSAINTQFCIKYSVAGSTFWDNNNTENYSVTLTSCGKPKPKPKSRRSKINSSFDFSAPSFPESSPRLQSAGDTPPAKNPVPYTELVSKLMNVKKDEQRRVPLFKSLSTSNVNAAPPSRPASQARPKYSKSYKARTASSPPAQEPNLLVGNGSVTPPPKEATPAESKEEESIPRSVGAFHETQFNSNTYAALLRTYCFSGTPSANNSVNNSPTNSNSSNRPEYDCASPASTFHSLSDSIHI